MNLTEVLLEKNVKNFGRSFFLSLTLSACGVMLPGTMDEVDNGGKFSFEMESRRVSSGKICELVWLMFSKQGFYILKFK